MRQLLTTTLKTIRLTCIFLIVILLSTAPASAAEQYPELPSNDNFIVDQAGVISETDADKINAIAQSLWNEKNIPLVIVTIKSLASMESYSNIETYTRALFDHWQLGLENRNYGMLVVLAVKDRKARIELGSAWDNQYNKQATVIMQDYMVPEFRNKNYSEGLLAATQALNNLARGLDLPEIKRPWWVMPLLIIFTISIIAIIYSLFKSGRKGWGWALIIFIGVILYLAVKAGSSISGGGSGGGGGATGSW